MALGEQFARGERVEPILGSRELTLIAALRLNDEPVRANGDAREIVVLGSTPFDPTDRASRKLQNAKLDRCVDSARIRIALRICDQRGGGELVAIGRWNRRCVDAREDEKLAVRRPP